MSKEHEINEEEIVAFLLGEVDEQREKQIKKILDEDPSLEEKKEFLLEPLDCWKHHAKPPFNPYLKRNGN